MKIIQVVISRGSEDYGCWVRGFKGVYGAGLTPNEAVHDLEKAIELYRKHNTYAPKWMHWGSFKIKRLPSR